MKQVVQGGGSSKQQTQSAVSHIGPPGSARNPIRPVETPPLSASASPFVEHSIADEFNRDR
jgi:hypothetical protein